MSQHFLEYVNGLILLAIKDIYHMDKALEACEGTKNQARSVAKLEDRVKDVAKAYKKKPFLQQVQEETSFQRRSTSWSHLRNSRHHEYRVHRPTESKILALPAHEIDHRAHSAEDGRVGVTAAGVPALETPTIYYVNRLPTGPSWRTSHQSTYQKCSSRSIKHLPTFLTSNTTVWPKAANMAQNMLKIELRKLLISCRCRCATIQLIQSPWTPSSILYWHSKPLLTAIECQKVPSCGFPLLYM